MENILEKWTTITDEILSEKIDFTLEEISNLLSNMGLIEFQEECHIEDLERYIFLYCNDQEIYCSDERSFIERVGSVFIYNDINRRTNKGTIATKIIAADLCQFSDAIRSCLFLMKVINKATEEFNIFLFKTNEGFYIGCRLYNTDIFKNCSLSYAIQTDTELDEIIQRLTYLPNTDEFIPFYRALLEVIEYEESCLQDYDLKIMLRRGVNFSYLDILSDIEKIYHINLERAREMHYESFEKKINNIITFEYSSIMDTLRFIKSEKANTLEMLFEAEEMALLAKENEQKNEQILLLPDVVKTRDSSNDNNLKEHLDDPELMIKLLRTQKGL
ncbi:MAG: hypothetical protein WCI30_05085 [Clostridia bacterium]